jgi:hypothetical protein
LEQKARFSDVHVEDGRRVSIETMIAWGRFGQQQPDFKPDAPVNWGTLDRWLAALSLPGFKSLAHAQVRDHPLTRAECVDYLYRVLQARGEALPETITLSPDDALPLDEDNDNILDHLEP